MTHVRGLPLRADSADAVCGIALQRDQTLRPEPAASVTASRSLLRGSLQGFPSVAFAMSEGNPQDTTASETGRGGRGAPEPPQGVSPYATGGGGFTFERQVAVQYLAHMLAGDGASELGDGRRVVNVAFQQAPAHPADDLVVSAAYSDESRPSLVLAIAVRRSPKLVQSDESTRKLFRGFVRALVDIPAAGPEHRWGLVVAGPQPHARQLALLVSLAVGQSDAPGFFECVHSQASTMSAFEKDWIRSRCS